MLPDTAEVLDAIEYGVTDIFREVGFRGHIAWLNGDDNSIFFKFTSLEDKTVSYEIIAKKIGESE